MSGLHVRSGWMVAMAVADAPSSLVVAGCDDGSVWVWDLEARSVRHPPVMAHDGPVTALATGVVDGAPVVVASVASSFVHGTVRAWWLASGMPMGPPLAGQMSKDPVAVGSMDGRLVVISPDAHERVCVWDPATARVLVAFDRSGGPVTALAVTELHGRQVVVWGDMQGQMAVGDVAAGHVVARMTGGHERDVGAIVMTVLDRRPVVVSGADDGTVRRWDLASGAPLGPPSRGHEGPLHAPGRIYALTIARLAGRPVAVSSGWDGELWVWDLGRGERVGEPLDDYEGDVQALMTTRINGRQVVVCGGIDEPVLRVWDLDRRTLDWVLPSPAHVQTLAPLPASSAIERRQTP